MVNKFDIIETNEMMTRENLDIRTITMGISLMDCISDNIETLCKNIYEKIYLKAHNLIGVANDISNEYGILIVNKRVSVTPISLVGASAAKSVEDFVKIAKTLDKVAHDIGVDFIGGYTAIVAKGATEKEELFMDSIPMALKETKKVCASLNVGSTRIGINMTAVKKCGEIVKKLSNITENSFGCAKFVIFCNAPDDNPFMAGAFHGVSEPDCVVSVGVSGPGVVNEAVKQIDGQSFDVLCDTIKNISFKITRLGQFVAREASKRLKVPFGIIDLSLAPTPARGDSIAEILESMGLDMVGAPGTTCALALLNDSVKKGGVMASSHVGGLSGAFIPVSEDSGMIDATIAGSLNIEKLEAMTCVCSVGLDMVAIEGSVEESTISGIVADEMAIGMINAKTTAVRIIPVNGMNVGDVVEFGGLLGRAPIMKVNTNSCKKFIDRCGRIPAPIHSFKN